jgi:hypothetical protein
MRRRVLVGLATALGIVAIGAAPASACDSRGGCGPYGYYAPPVYSYYAPPPVYYAPPPVYSYYAAPRAYYAPVPAFGYYASPSAYFNRQRSFRRFSPL